MTEKQPLLAKTEEQREFWRKLQPVYRVAATDTYKRTMAGSGEIFGNNLSCYILSARSPLKEEGTNGRYIMAGLEFMLYPWFLNPITEKEIEKVQEFFEKNGQVRKFPEKVWQKVLDNNGYFPINIWSLRGGQTFLVKDGKHVPIASVEGIGALVSHIEPHLEHMYAPIIQATKARLMYEAVGSKFAEFGYRSDKNENTHVILMMALYVGAGFQLTSDDQAVMLFPEYFKDVGTIGHEFIMAYQKSGRTLEEAQEKAFIDFVESNDRSALLPDVIDTVRSGMPAILNLVKKYHKTEKIIMPRFDSGNVSEQCILWKKMTLEAGIQKTMMVVEDGYTPKKGRDTKRLYARAGFDPEEIIVGAGGYFQENCNRDSMSLAFKRSVTMHEGKLEASMKFSDSPGKESIPGQIRVYGKDRKIIVAQSYEEINAELLMQKVLDNGRISYFEDLNVQRERANKTWNLYNEIEYSSETKKIIELRRAEKVAIAERYCGVKK